MVVAGEDVLHAFAQELQRERAGSRAPLAPGLPSATARGARACRSGGWIEHASTGGAPPMTFAMPRCVGSISRSSAVGDRRLRRACTATRSRSTAYAPSLRRSRPRPVDVQGAAPDRQARQRIGLDARPCGARPRPSSACRRRRVEGERGVEVAQRDVPAHDVPAASTRVQVRVARLVRARRSREASRAQRDERRPTTRQTTCASWQRIDAPSRRPIARSAGAPPRAAASPLRRAACAKTSRSSGSRCCAHRRARARARAPASCSTTSANIACSRPCSARLRPLVRERDALAHLGGVAQRPVPASLPAIASRSRTASVRGSSFSTCERLGGPPLLDQEIGIRDRGVGVGAELQHAAIGGLGGGGRPSRSSSSASDVSQPAPRRRRQARHRRAAPRMSRAAPTSPRSAAFSARQAARAARAGRADSRQAASDSA